MIDREPVVTSLDGGNTLGGRLCPSLPFDDDPLFGGGEPVPCLVKGRFETGTHLKRIWKSYYGYKSVYI